MINFIEYFIAYLFLLTYIAIESFKYYDQVKFITGVIIGVILMFLLGVFL